VKKLVRREQATVVAYLSSSGEMGGAERMLLDLLTSIRNAAPTWPLHLIIPCDGPLRQDASAIGVTTTIVPFPPALERLGDSSGGGDMRRLVAALPATTRYVRQLRAALRTIAPRIVHTNGFKMHALGTLASPHGTPVVWHMHDYVTTRPIMKRLMRLLAGRATIALANSRSVADDVRLACGTAVRVETMYNAVDLTRYTPLGTVLSLDALGGMRAALPDTLRVGLVATFARWKGHEVFLRAIASLPPDLRIRAYIVGGGIYQTDESQHTLGELRALAGRLSLEDRVVFTGHVADPAAVYRGLDVVVHASTSPEPFGLVIAEAMACGRAVVVSAAGGASELIRPGVDALTYPAGDVLALANCILRLASSPLERARLGGEARRSAEQRFDRRRLATEALSTYRAVIAAA
jgi:glycosyltransferase involved in cell wall biosynthesis